MINHYCEYKQYLISQHDAFKNESLKTIDVVKKVVNKSLLGKGTSHE